MAEIIQLWWDELTGNFLAKHGGKFQLSDCNSRRNMHSDAPPSLFALSTTVTSAHDTFVRPLSVQARKLYPFFSQTNNPSKSNWHTHKQNVTQGFVSRSKVLVTHSTCKVVWFVLLGFPVFSPTSPLQSFWHCLPPPVTPYTPTLFLRYQNIRPPKFDGNDNVGVRFNKCSMISKKTKKEEKKKRTQILAIPKAQDGVTRWHMKLKCTPVKSCTHLTEFTCVHLLGKTFGKSYSITKYYQLLECRTLYTLMLQLFCVFPRAKWKNWARLF